jgi:O-methyltransferase
MKTFIRKIHNRIFPPTTTPINLAAQFVFSEAVPGDYLEFGVFKGASFIEAIQELEIAHKKWGAQNKLTNKQDYSEESAERADAHFTTLEFKRSVRYFAFDSFQGLPDLHEMDLGHSRFRKGRYDFSETNFISNVISKTSLQKDRLKTIPGFYNDSLSSELYKKLDLQQAAIIMIDCDLYSSTKEVLKFITPLVVDGSILIFDDWYAYKGSPFKGERRATAEWLEINPHITLSEFSARGAHQRAFIVNFRDSTCLKD